MTSGSGPFIIDSYGERIKLSEKNKQLKEELAEAKLNAAHSQGIVEGMMNAIRAQADKASGFSAQESARIYAVAFKAGQEHEAKMTTKAPPVDVRFGQHIEAILDYSENIKNLPVVLQRSAMKDFLLWVGRQL